MIGLLQPRGIERIRHCTAIGCREEQLVVVATADRVFVRCSRRHRDVSQPDADHRCVCDSSHLGGEPVGDIDHRRGAGLDGGLSRSQPGPRALVRLGEGRFLSIEDVLGTCRSPARLPCLEQSQACRRPAERAGHKELVSGLRSGAQDRTATVGHMPGHGHHDDQLSAVERSPPTTAAPQSAAAAVTPLKSSSMSVSGGAATADEEMVRNPAHRGDIADRGAHGLPPEIVEGDEPEIGVDPLHHRVGGQQLHPPSPATTAASSPIQTSPAGGPGSIAEMAPITRSSPLSFGVPPSFEGGRLCRCRFCGCGSFWPPSHA